MHDDEKLNAARRAILSCGVHVDTRWVHVKTGGVYRIVALAVEESSLTPIVVYSHSDRPVLAWTRPLATFCDGRFVLELDYRKPQSDTPKE